MNTPKPLPLRPVAAVPASALPKVRLVDRLEQNPIRKIGLYLLLIYIFLSVSRLLDIVFSGYHIPLVIYLLMGTAAVMSGGLFRVFQSRIALTMIALVAWEAATVPFSAWPGGSTLMLWESIRALGVALIVVSVCVGPTDPGLMTRVIGFSALAGSLSGIFYGKLSFGRLVTDQGSFSDPNMYAATLLIGLPVWLMLVYTSPNKLVRIGAFACMIPIMYAFLKAGSRGGMIGLVCVFIGLFVQVKFFQKIVALGICGVVLLLALVTLPDYVRNRFSTFYSSDGESNGLAGGDIGSTHARVQLFWDSVSMTLRHPIFGIGMDQFGQANWEQAQSHGERGLTNVTHNTYTQLSSETGLPGLLLFLALLYQSFQALNRVLRLGKSPAYKIPANLMNTARYLRLCFIGLCACAAFLSLAYGSLFYLMGAVAAGVDQVMQRNLTRWKVVPASMGSPLTKPSGVGVSPAALPVTAKSGQAKLGQFAGRMRA